MIVRASQSRRPETKAEMGTVITQLAMILFSMLHFTCFLPCSYRPMQMTDPTWQCVEETGIPVQLASTTLRVDPSSMEKPVGKSICVRSFPIVLIT